MAETGIRHRSDMLQTGYARSQCEYPHRDTPRFAVSSTSVRTPGVALSGFPLRLSVDSIIYIIYHIYINKKRKQHYEI
jgi:hypothetical protein